jgi:outer membrane protein assembly factor BamB
MNRILSALLASVAALSSTAFVSGSQPSHDNRPRAIDRGMIVDELQSRPSHLLPGGPTQPTYGKAESSATRAWRHERPLLAHPAWFRADAEIFSRPCFDSQSMYFGDCSGVFHCLDKKTGETSWKIEKLSRIDSSPLVKEGIVYFAAINNKFYAANADTGDLLWNVSLPGSGYNSPQFANGAVYIAGRGELLALAPRRGEILKRYPLPGDGRSVTGNSKAILTYAQITHPAENDPEEGAVVCFDPDSTAPRWTTRLGGESYGTLICDEDKCYLGVRDGFFYALRLSDGSIAWRIDCRMLFSPPEPEFVLDESLAKNPSWVAWAKQPKEGIWADGHAIDLGATVAFVGRHQCIDNPSVLAVADKQTGKIVCIVQHPSKIQDRFLEVEGVIVAIAEDRKMLLIRTADGTSVSIDPLPTFVRGEFGGVSFDEGSLFVSGADARIWRLPFDSVKGALQWPRADHPEE